MPHQRTDRFDSPGRRTSSGLRGWKFDQIFGPNGVLPESIHHPLEAISLMMIFAISLGFSIHGLSQLAKEYRANPTVTVAKLKTFSPNEPVNLSMCIEDWLPKPLPPKVLAGLTGMLPFLEVYHTEEDRGRFLVAWLSMQDNLFRAYMNASPMGILLLKRGNISSITDVTGSSQNTSFYSLWVEFPKQICHLYGIYLITGIKTPDSFQNVSLCDGASLAASGQICTKLPLTPSAMRPVISDAIIYINGLKIGPKSYHFPRPRVNLGPTMLKSDKYVFINNGSRWHEVEIGITAIYESMHHKSAAPNIYDTYKECDYTFRAKSVEDICGCTDFVWSSQVKHFQKRIDSEEDGIESVGRKPQGRALCKLEDYVKCLNRWSKERFRVMTEWIRKCTNSHIKRQVIKYWTRSQSRQGQLASSQYRISIAFTSTPYPHFFEVNRISWQNLVGNIGGVIGLWLGMDLISVYFIFLSCLRACRKKRGPIDVSATSPHITAIRRSLRRRPAYTGDVEVNVLNNHRNEMLP